MCLPYSRRQIWLFNILVCLSICQRSVCLIIDRSINHVRMVLVDSPGNPHVTVESVFFPEESPEESPHAGVTTPTNRWNILCDHSGELTAVALLRCKYCAVNILHCNCCSGTAGWRPASAVLGEDGNDLLSKRLIDGRLQRCQRRQRRQRRQRLQRWCTITQLQPLQQQQQPTSHHAQPVKTRGDVVAATSTPDTLPTTTKQQLQDYNQNIYKGPSVSCNWQTHISFSSHFLSHKTHHQVLILSLIQQTHTHLKKKLTN